MLFRSSEYGTAAGLVRNGLGIAFVPGSAAAGFDGVVTVRVVPAAAPDWRILVATSATRRPSAAARAFLDWLI